MLPLFAFFFIHASFMRHTTHGCVTRKAGCPLGLPLRETLHSATDIWIHSISACVRRGNTLAHHSMPTTTSFTCVTPAHHHQLLLRHPSQAPTQLSSRRRCALCGVDAVFQLDAVSLLRVGLALVEVDPEQEGDGEQVPRDHQ